VAPFVVVVLMALGQTTPEPATEARLGPVLGRAEPQADAYDQQGVLKPVVTLESSASITGLPVRQQPVNLGLFAHGCSQCHRITGALPAHNDAPADVFTQVPTPAPTTPVPAGFRRLTDDGARASAPMWSPDGRRILYEAESSDGRFALWLMAADGGERYALTHDGNAGWANWSPDGTRIVYWASDSADRGNLWLVNADGSGARRLTDVAMVAFPVWSPDGRAIAYQARDDQGTWTLDLLSLAGGSSRRVSPPDQTMPSRPQWSPDGRQIAYQVADGGAFGLWRMTFPLDGAGRPDYAATPSAVPGSTLLPMDLGQAAGSSTWSPDGKRIALQMPALVMLPTGQAALSYKTWLTRPDGTDPLLLGPSPTLADRSPSWSPDGRWVALWSWNRDLMAAVWLVRPDGGRAVDLTQGLGADAMFPSWSPDGTQVAFSSDRSGSFDIWVADVAKVVPGFRP